jgi:hypothetical protein
LKISRLDRAFTGPGRSRQVPRLGADIRDDRVWHVTRDQLRALRLLADVPRGIAESLMTAHGCSRELISDLMLFGLATVVTDTVRIGGETIEVELVMITDAGRRVLESVTARRPSPRSPGAQ